MSEVTAWAGPDFGFGIYIHWPFCKAICPYCDFNVYAAKTRDTRALVDAICADLVMQAAMLDAVRAPDTVYFGGGTPSLMAGADIARVLDTIAGVFGPARGEVTLEANPEDVSADACARWAALGINRLSLGAQSVDDEALRFLGRAHTGVDVRRALEAASPHVDSVSVDLIYARPGQSAGSWTDELGAVLDMAPAHLSLYELTIEEKTAFGRRAARGELVPMDDDAQADLYELTQSLCEAAGLPAYEVSNHAREPGTRSAHNGIYWNSGDWIGVGPGAHGRVTSGGARLETIAIRRPADYVAAAEAGGACHASTALSTADAARELLAMGLRPVDGIARHRVELALGPLDAGISADLVGAGLLSLEGNHIRLTANGRLLADAVTSRLLLSSPA